MINFIKKIKEHPVITSIGVIIAIMAGITTSYDFRDKVCSSVSTYLEPKYLENEMQHIWTDLSKNEIKQKFGSPLIKDRIGNQDIWIYKTTNSFFALGFDESNLINQFIIAVPENSLDTFSGYRVHHSDVYGNFTLGKDTLGENGSTDLKITDMGIGAQIGFVYARIDPPYIVRKNGYNHDIELKAFDTHIFNRTMFGNIMLNTTLLNQINDCNIPECTQKDKEEAIIKVSTTIPGWIHVSKGEASKINDVWLIEKFALANLKDVEYGGYISKYCMNYKVQK